MRTLHSLGSALGADPRESYSGHYTDIQAEKILAPLKVAVLPLTKKDNMPEKAREIMSLLQIDFNCQYEEKDSIGKRYRRQDAIGTPFCITIDHKTLEDNTVTLRDRDSMKQERVSIEKLHSIISEKVNLAKYLT